VFSSACVITDQDSILGMENCKNLLFGLRWIWIMMRQGPYYIDLFRRAIYRLN
jgi:hypothetical protein